MRVLPFEPSHQFAQVPAGQRLAVAVRLSSRFYLVVAHFLEERKPPATSSTMEAPRRAANRQKQRSRRFWIILSVVVLVVLIVVIVPTAVILSGRQRSKGLASSVILPLYIYPLDDAWQPLYNAYVLISKSCAIGGV